MIKETLKFYNDFPSEGIVFVDIIPLLQSKQVFNELIKELSERTSAPNIIAPEARGFLFAAPLLASKPGVENIIPIRKKGKLPFAEGDLCDVEIMKEYGADHLYYRLSDIAASKLSDDGKIHLTIIDDVLATGGTAEGIAKSITERKIMVDGIEREVVIDEFIFVVELDFLNGAERLNQIAPVKSIVHL
ncbi:MAG: hypothetical protein IKY82_06260 [Alistipes sp.]|nr:hypothetical protein [Alistipes sp.]